MSKIVSFVRGDNINKNLPKRAKIQAPDSGVSSSNKLDEYPAHCDGLVSML